MGIKTRFYEYMEKNHEFTVKKRERRSILNSTYSVVKGSVRTDDYDDAWMLALGMHATNVLDIGCNMGASTMLLLHGNSVEKIVCVDPNPKALSITADNLIYNNFSLKGIFIPAFVSDKKDEVLEFHTASTGEAGSMYKDMAHTASRYQSSIQVTTTTVDDIIEETGVDPDLIKIDVEGAEMFVLKGALKMASRKKARLLVEMHRLPDHSMEDCTRPVLEWCSENGYKPWYMKTKEELTDPQTVSHRGRYHLLLQPQSMDFPDFLKSIKQGADLSDVPGAIK